MMRLANVPLTLGLPTLAVASAIVGFRGALAYALILYAVAFVSYVVVKWRVMAQVGYFDNAWPLSAVGAYLALPTKVTSALTLVLGVFGWAAVVASVYLFLRLWIWFPSEVPVLPGTPIVGALVTVGALWV